MEYSKEFLSQFKVDATNYTYVPVDNQPHVVPLIRKGTTKLLQDCQGCRCLPGGRKDGKAVVFKIEYIYQVHEQ